MGRTTASASASFIRQERFFLLCCLWASSKDEERRERPPIRRPNQTGANAQIWLLSTPNSCPTSFLLILASFELEMHICENRIAFGCFPQETVANHQHITFCLRKTINPKQRICMFGCKMKWCSNLLKYSIWRGARWIQIYVLVIITICFRCKAVSLAPNLIPGLLVTRLSFPFLGCDSDDQDYCPGFHSG